jgi:hypothetical protein
MIIEPYRSEEFIQNFSQVVPFAPPNYIDLIEIVVPAKSKMTILDFGNYCDTWAAWGVIYWDFYCDDRPLYPYDHIMDQIGFGTGRQAVQGVPIFGGHRFRVRATNPTAADVRMGISLRYKFDYQE